MEINEKIFTEYYYKNTWAGKESISGPGSDYAQTKYLIKELEFLLAKLNITTIFDAPCGDFNWMKKIDLSRIKYIGGDIVKPLIHRNEKKYKTKNIKFIEFNLINDKLPKTDLVIVRDCFVHLKNEDIFKALNNIKKSESKYLLTTHFTWDSAKCNQDIKTGQWRRLNLTKKPFNFPFPEHIIVEGNFQSNDHDKTMSLWNISNIPDYGDLDV